MRAWKNRPAKPYDRGSTAWRRSTLSKTCETPAPAQYVTFQLPRAGAERLALVLDSVVDDVIERLVRTSEPRLAKPFELIGTLTQMFATEVRDALADLEDGQDLVRVCFPQEVPAEVAPIEKLVRDVVAGVWSGRWVRFELDGKPHHAQVTSGPENDGQVEVVTPEGDEYQVALDELELVDDNEVPEEVRALAS